MSHDLRSFFLLRPDVAFLNHGSFGACPRPVFERYGQWQRELEAEPVEFLGRRLPDLLRDARNALGAYLHADPVDLVYVTNATTGVNIVARSLKLGSGDEVLGTNHEYGACDRAWRFICSRNGSRYRQAVMPLPMTTHEEFVERFLAQVTPATKLIFISAITSFTGLTFPVAEICRRAREMGIMTLVDGAHVPGQIPLDLEAVGADFYTGNLHKWLCAPKGSAFLHARREVQSLLEPLVVSWGWEALKPGDSPFIDYLQFGGTADISAALSVPAAIEFHREHDWPNVVARCHELVRRARPAIEDALGARAVAPDSDEWYMQMSTFVLPPEIDAFELQRLLFDEHLVEIPAFSWSGNEMIRISIQGYNTWEDVERLLKGIEALRSRVTR